MTAPAEAQFVTVARILRARGNKGEVAAELLSDFPERLAQLPSVFLQSAAGAPREIGLRAFWVDRNHPGNCVFHFAGVDSIDAAEQLRGQEVQIPFSQRAMLPSGSHFVTDLIGCEVFESANAALLGRVRDVYFPGDEGQAGTPLLSIAPAHAPGQEFLVPLAQDICTLIDTAARRIVVRLPDGLRELNQ
ncbi:MAG TPA: ribosome maturation factor RimM [Dongiaceae bacterium]|nr:ribosome maturation factor RimM [Dongiaceae bacterium]